MCIRDSGNLWVENTAVVGNQTFTYDPACYWGDRECDLAFSELFQPFSPEFYEIYDRTFPLDKQGFEERKHLYQLYYLLNFSHRLDVYKRQIYHYTRLICQKAFFQ